MSDPNAYCRDLVQKRDYESFLLSQFYAKEQQNAFLALRAFYVSFMPITLRFAHAMPLIRSNWLPCQRLYPMQLSAICECNSGEMH